MNLPPGRTPASSAALLSRAWLLVLLGCALGSSPRPAEAAHPAIRLVPAAEPQQVFGGAYSNVAVCWENLGDDPYAAELSTRLYQASSATAILVGEVLWKKLTVWPGQRVLASASVLFPAVRAETRFLVQWVEAEKKVLGTTEVWVYPPDLLKALKPLVAEGQLGVLDPLAEIKPLLLRDSLEFVDLENPGLTGFSGKAAVIGPFRNAGEMPAGLARRVKSLAKNGVAVIWLVPPADSRADLTPSFYTVGEGKAAVVVARSTLVEDLAGNPRAQLNLLQLVRLALRPEPPRLPYFTP